MCCIVRRCIWIAGGDVMRIKLPEPYVDCVIQHEDGSKRIGRLHFRKAYFELASYQNRKEHVLWPIENVVGYSVINFDLQHE